MLIHNRHSLSDKLFEIIPSAILNPVRSSMVCHPVHSVQQLPLKPSSQLESIRLTFAFYAGTGHSELRLVKNIEKSVLQTQYTQSYFVILSLWL